MKKAVFTLFCLSIYLLSMAQNSFERHYGAGSSLDEFVAVSNTPDGGWLFAGRTVNFGSQGADLLLVHTDTEGDTLWLRTWGGAGDEAATALQAAPGGGYFVSGYVSSPAGDRDWLVLKIGDDGQEIWHATFGEDKDDVCTGIVPLANGSVIGVGHFTTSLYQDIMAMYFDATGNVVWGKQYDAPSFNLNNPIGAIAVDNGFILAQEDGVLRGIDLLGTPQWQNNLLDPAGSTVRLDRIKRVPDGTIMLCGETFSGTPFYARIDEDGTLLDFRSFWAPFFPPFPGSYRAADIAPLPDGRVALVLRRSYPGFETGDELVLAVYNPAIFGFTWTADYATAGLAGLLPVRSLLPMPDGGFLLAGSIATPAEGVEAFYQRYTPDGMLVSSEKYGVAGVWDVENGYAVVPTADNGFVVLGSKITAGNGTDFWLVRTDANGTVQWDGLYGLPGDEWPVDLDIAADGGFLAAGTDALQRLRVMKIAASGQTQWIRTYDLELADRHMTVHGLPDGGSALAFTRVSDDASGFTQGFLLRLDSDGDSLWGRSYQFTTHGTALYGLDQAPNGNFIVGGFVETDQGYVYPASAITDADGAPLTWTSYNTQDLQAILLDVVADPGGGWVGTGVRVDSTSGTFFPFFLRVDFSGTPVWLTKPDYPGAISSAAWAAARQPLPDATFLFEETLLQHGGLPLLDTRDRVGAVQKLDGQGQLLCTEMFGQGHAAAFLGGAATADGGAIAVGSGIFNQSRDVFLVKVGPDCAVGFMTPLQAPFEVILSPNPSPGDLAIRLSGEAHGEVEFRVFKADGTPILSGSGEKSAGVDWQQQCSLAQLPKGAYFIWVKVGQQARTQSWIKTGW